VAVGVIQQRAGLAAVAMIEQADFGGTVGHRADLLLGVSCCYASDGSPAKVAPPPHPRQTLAAARELG
jgi:uncharacterized protein with PIN domain